MLQLTLRFVTIAALAFLLSGSQLVFALGPADGSDLPPTDLERIKIGQSAPDFSLEDEQGNVITLSQFRDQKNVVLVFYRGRW